MSEAYQNRLIHEKSPYLLQHAHNPVDWYPWGQEAFDAAKSSNKPIFLSIGYATCHWCHVMEKESFENPEIAKLLNETFINIKLDREEYPEVDVMYMELSQAIMSAGGGWPLNVILTPDLKPFFAVTYVPPDNRRGMMGLRQIVDQISKLWQGEERELIFDQADKIIEAFGQTIQPQGDSLPSEEDYLSCIEVLFDLADPLFGGMKGAPKFPLGFLATLFLTFGKKKSESRALFFVGLTLDMMHRGGIYDQLGGGFSRYSVDDRWMIPHFEKMLYDNALLSVAYLQASKCLDNAVNYREIAKEILDFVLKDLTNPEGGFYSAQDADLEGKEGFYYTWKKEEITNVLSGDEGPLFCEYFGVTPNGNFEGRNVLFSPLSLEEFSDRSRIPSSKISEVLANAKTKLLNARQSRKAPFVDDKILSSSNGLMIDACAHASGLLENDAYLEAAIRAAQFIKTHLWKEGILLRRYRDGEAKISGGLDEYAYLIKGLISLFEENCGSEWLAWAIELCKKLEQSFKSPGGAFYSVEENTDLLLRNCEFYDGAEPSGNAVHAENLLRLYQITQNVSFLSQAEDILKAAKEFILQYPPASCYHLIALGRFYDLKAPTIIVALDSEHTLEKEIKSVLSRCFLPHAAIIWKKEEDSLIASLLPNMKDKTPIDGQTAVYVCFQNSCQPPLLSWEEIEKMIKNL